MLLGIVPEEISHLSSLEVLNVCECCFSFWLHNMILTVRPSYYLLFET